MVTTKEPALPEILKSLPGISLVTSAPDKPPKKSATSVDISGLYRTKTRGTRVTSPPSNLPPTSVDISALYKTPARLEIIEKPTKKRDTSTEAKSLSTLLKDRKELSILRTPAASNRAPDTVLRSDQRQPRRGAPSRSSSSTQKPSGPEVITRTPAPAANTPSVQQDKSLPKGWSKMKLEGGRTQLVSP